MAQEVVLYHSGMAGAPSGTVNVLGGLIAVLDACLVNGFGTVSISSMAHAGGVVTVTTVSPHGYATGEFKEVLGADQADYNGRWKITVTSSNAFTFAIATTPVTPATGTMSVKNPAAGWTRPITGASTATYRSKTPGSNGHYLQVEDNNPYADSNVGARVRAVVSATAFDAGDQLGEQIRIQKANGGWVLAADGRTCYLIMNATNVLAFGEFESYRAADGYNFFVSRGENANGSVNGHVVGRHFPAVCSPSSSYSATTYGASLLRAYSQIGGSAFGTPMLPTLDGSGGGSLNSVTSSWQGALSPSPNPVDAAIVCATVPLLEVTSSSGSNAFAVRGILRGVYLPLGRLTPAGFVNNLQRLDDVVIGGQIESLVACQFGASSAVQMAFDIGETW